MGTIFSALQKNPMRSHCMERVRNWSFSGPYFPAFELNTERYFVYLPVFTPNAGKYGPEKLRIWTLLRSEVWIKID